MKSLLNRIRLIRSRRDEGASAVEYGLLVALIAVVIAAGVIALGQVLGNAVADACQEIAATSTDGTTAADCPRPEDDTP